MTQVYVITDDMITAGLRAWFGEDGPFFSSLKSQQRDYMRQALEAALRAAPASPECLSVSQDAIDALSLLPDLVGALEKILTLASDCVQFDQENLAALDGEAVADVLAVTAREVWRGRVLISMANRDAFENIARSVLLKAGVGGDQGSSGAESARTGPVARPETGSTEVGRKG